MLWPCVSDTQTDTANVSFIQRSLVFLYFINWNNLTFVSLCHIGLLFDRVTRTVLIDTGASIQQFSDKSLTSLTHNYDVLTYIRC